MAKKQESLADIQQVKSFEDADRALLELGKIDAVLADKESQLNAEIQQLREKADLATVELRQKKIALESTLEKFVLSNKDEFEKERSRDLIHGTIGLRWTPPKIAILNRKYNINSALELLKRFKWGKAFVRVKEEVDKEALLAARNANEIDDTNLAAAGLKIDSKENFFYAIKWESVQ